MGLCAWETSQAVIATKVGYSMWPHSSGYVVQSSLLAWSRFPVAAHTPQIGGDPLSEPILMSAGHPSLQHKCQAITVQFNGCDMEKC